MKAALHPRADVVGRLNDLLARLEAAMSREKSFTADVAHELRTPLAGLSSTLEVCASRPRESAEYQHVVARCLTITRGLESMVNNLLLLARELAGPPNTDFPLISLWMLTTAIFSPRK